ncbi:MAG TPA: BTAD domain-containing putative transcriptional regulator [Gemmatimonadales bacterium]|nr:BTAD domain-containing putative transcriptional regulator [Gemmatimonadales bacterium]
MGRLHVSRAEGAVSGSAAQPRRLAVLALLASAGEQGLTREKLLAYLWAEADEERARRGLNQALYALRQDLGSDDIFLGTRHLRLNAELVSSDLAEFGQALAVGKLEDAAARYTGPFLDGFHLPGAPEFERWAEEERADLARNYAQSLGKLASRAESRGDWTEAVGWWRKLAAQDPLNATVALSLMRALAAAGDRAGALQHARIYEVLLQQELDSPPDREVVALAAELRAAETTPPPPMPRVKPEPVPVAAEPAPASMPGPPEPAPMPAPEVVIAGAGVPGARAGLRRVTIALALLLTGAAGGLYLRARPPAELVPGPAHRVAFDERLELDPALSPDGKMIAYSADDGTRFQIFVKQVAGGRAVAVTQELPGSHWRPQWSPDRSRMAFQAGGRIYEVPAFGGVPRVLVEPAHPGSWVASAAWSPDGRAIAYVEDWAVYRRAIGGGPATLLCRLANAHSLAWSPDGRWIALVSGNPGFIFGESPWGSSTNLGNIAPSSIWIVPAAGGNPIRITDDQALNTSPVWLPHTAGLLFVSNREGSRDVYRVDLSGAGVPAGEPTRLTTGLSAHSISLSADGRALAYSVFSYTANIWSLDIPEHGEAAEAGARPFTEGTQIIEGISLSPDGRWLAFDSDRDGNQDVYKMPIGGGEAEQLTDSPDDEFVSTWSGDGKALALHSYHAGSRGLRLVPADGGRPVEVVRWPPNQRSPGWSRDGRALVFTSDVTGELQLFLVRRKSDSTWGTARQLTTAGGWAGRWSPDGRSIVYCRADGVWLIDDQGRGNRQLFEAGDSGSPSPELALWSPDGRTIYFKAFDAAGSSSLWAISPSGSAPRLLVRFDDPSRPSSRPEFATDGRRFFFTLGTRQSDIWAMELRRR